MKKAEKAKLHWPALSLYTSTGRKIVFPSEPSAMAIRVMGPYIRDTQREHSTAREARDRWSGCYVNSDFLSLGLDVACSALIRLESARKPEEQPFSFQFAGTPFSKDVVANGRKVVALTGPTQADERALVGASPALLQFFEIAARTPGLQDVVLDLLKISKLSILLSGGRIPDVYMNFNHRSFRVDPLRWSLTKGTPVYALPWNWNSTENRPWKVSSSSPPRELR